MHNNSPAALSPLYGLLLSMIDIVYPVYFNLKEVRASRASYNVKRLPDNKLPTALSFLFKTEFLLVAYHEELLSLNTLPCSASKIRHSHRC